MIGHQHKPKKWKKFPCKYFKYKPLQTQDRCCVGKQGKILQTPARLHLLAPLTRKDCILENISSLRSGEYRNRTNGKDLIMFDERKYCIHCVNLQHKTLIAHAYMENALSSDPNASSQITFSSTSTIPLESHNGWLPLLNRRTFQTSW